MKRFIWGAVFGIVLLIALPLVFLLTGAFNIGATQQPSPVEATLANWTVNRSVGLRAPQEVNPLADNPEALQSGLAHYKNSCVHCHGAPGVQPSDFASGLNPPAPLMADVTKRWSDGEFFWITKHGIRLTGMPAFGGALNDDDIWSVVAFVRHLNNLSESEIVELRTARVGNPPAADVQDAGHREARRPAEARVPDSASESLER
jgi:mono/diheme cytochrome c family protein